MVSGVEDAICRATDDLILYSNRVDYNRDCNSIFETKQQVLPVNELAKPTLALDTRAVLRHDVSRDMRQMRRSSPHRTLPVVQSRQWQRPAAAEPSRRGSAAGGRPAAALARRAAN